VQVRDVACHPQGRGCKVSHAFSTTLQWGPNPSRAAASPTAAPIRQRQCNEQPPTTRCCCLCHRVKEVTKDQRNVTSPQQDSTNRMCNSPGLNLTQYKANRTKLGPTVLQPLRKK
jgi:hypothetical protein